MRPTTIREEYGLVLCVAALSLVVPVWFAHAQGADDFSADAQAAQTQANQDQEAQAAQQAIVDGEDQSAGQITSDGAVDTAATFDTTSDAQAAVDSGATDSGSALGQDILSSSETDSQHADSLTPADAELLITNDQNSVDLDVDQSQVDQSQTDQSQQDQTTIDQSQVDQSAPGDQGGSGASDQDASTDTSTPAPVAP